VQSLPISGSVLGIDVGWSARTRSNAICRLDWDQSTIAWTIKRSRAGDDDRRTAIIECVGDVPILAAAIDGPLTKGFPVTGRYRAAERMLTRLLARRIGKPGQSSSPVGKKLNHHANLCARLALDHCSIGPWAHEIAIHEQAVVEAFPTTYLGLMLNEPERLSGVRGSRSDVYFTELAADGLWNGFYTISCRGVSSRCRWRR
jgi:hypothetical protein